jgi:hypothetical protein
MNINVGNVNIGLRCFSGWGKEVNICVVNSVARPSRKNCFPRLPRPAAGNKLRQRAPPRPVAFLERGQAVPARKTGRFTSELVKEKKYE